MGRKSLQTYRPAYLFRDAANLRKQEIVHVVIDHLIMHLTIHNPQEELRSTRILKFRGINMSENSISTYRPLVDNSILTLE